MTNQRLHWILGEHDEHAACGALAAGQARTTDLDSARDESVCPDCARLWTRYLARVTV